MNTTKFKSTVTKGNDKGAGFIRIPLEIRSIFSVEDQYKVTINSKIEYYSKIRDCRGKGIFVPIDINIKHNLYKKKAEVELQKVDGFYTRVGSEGRTYIPNFYKVKKGDIVLINANVDGKEIKKYCKINSREKDKTKEFTFYLDPHLSNKEVIFKISNNFQKNKLVKSKPFFWDVLKNFDFAEIEEDKIIIYYGNRVPIIVNSSIDIGNIAHYLGCYFADGTKRGTHWGICASTFDQACYFVSMHKYIVLDSSIIPSLTYTHYGKDTEEIGDKLTATWSKNTNLKIKNMKVRIIQTDIKYAPNRNQYGALSLKENRQLTQIFYNQLLNCLYDKIILENNKMLATDFICGAMEGDGCVNSKTQGHIIITTNNKEIELLKDICNRSYLKSSIRRWKGKKNRVDLVIGSLEIIRNIPILKDELFKYYPKRRKILKERLAQTGCARFLLGKSKKTSNWLIGQLNIYGILDGKGNLTKFGEGIKRDLKEFLTD